MRREAMEGHEGALLVLDTSAPAACVGVVVAGDVRADVVLRETRRHAEEIPSAIDEALRQAGVAPRAITRVVVGQGPGSFVGVRVALAIAKGIATARRVPLHGVSSLVALAGQEGVPEGRGLALLDARRGELYCQAVERQGEIVVARGPARALAPESVAAEVPGLAFVVGHGIELLSHVHAGATGAVPAIPATGPRASGLWRAFLGRWTATGDACADERRTLVPDYARAPDAKLPAAPALGASAGPGLV